MFHLAHEAREAHERVHVRRGQPKHATGLEDAVNLAQRRQGAVSQWFYAASQRVALSLKPGAPTQLSADLLSQARREDRAGLHDPTAGEELIVLARKA